jgi:hypothetical protein
MYLTLCYKCSIWPPPALVRANSRTQNTFCWGVVILKLTRQMLWAAGRSESAGGEEGARLSTLLATIQNIKLRSLWWHATLSMALLAYCEMKLRNWFILYERPCIREGVIFNLVMLNTKFNASAPISDAGCVAVLGSDYSIWPRLLDWNPPRGQNALQAISFLWFLMCM